jgi:hypothetical protein
MAFICNFGVKNGVHMWRVNGTITELTELLTAMALEGVQYKNGVAPLIEHVHRGEYTLLLELLIEGKGAAVSNDYRKNKTPYG